jgi:hypothetical protein
MLVTGLFSDQAVLQPNLFELRMSFIEEGGRCYIIVEFNSQVPLNVEFLHLKADSLA